MRKIIKESKYRVLSDNPNLEVSRVVTNERGALLMQISARNNSKKPVKMFSFVVAEFYIPQANKISHVLEHNWLQCSDVEYKGIDEHTNRKRFFLWRDQNEFSFNKDYGYIPNSIVSEWFTHLKSETGGLFIGAVTTKNQFSQIFVKSNNGRVFVRVTCQYDGLTLEPGESVKSEKIFFAHGETKKIKKDFALSLARHMNVKNVSLPIRAMCNSYYWNGNNINEAIINSQLEVLENLPQKLKLDYFQLDAGYTEYFGDWINYTNRFPSGFKQIINRIKKLGYSPGIWLSPFAVNRGLKFYSDKNSWFIEDSKGKRFEGRATSMFDKWNKFLALEVLDPTREDVKEYLKTVLMHFKNLGLTFFKLDFMYPLCLTTNYSKKVTRAEALREGLEHIRKVLGEECQILSGIVPLSPIVGIADHVRTGLDTLNPFVSSIPGIKTLVGNYMIKKNMKETMERIFLNGIIWRSDPDVLIFDTNSGIDENLIQKHKDMAEKNSISFWIGENIAKMNNLTLQKMVKFFNND